MRKPTEPQPKVLGQEDVQRWLMAFQKGVNQFDPSTIESLFHKNTIGFHSGMALGKSLTTELVEQLENLCPGIQHAFTFLMADARVIPAPGMFVVAIKAMTTRKIVGCEPSFFQLTFVLCDFDGKLLGVHSHVSPCPG